MELYEQPISVITHRPYRPGSTHQLELSGVEPEITSDKYKRHYSSINLTLCFAHEFHNKENTFSCYVDMQKGMP